MGRKDKLIARLLSRPVDFTFNELITLLRFLSTRSRPQGKPAVRGLHLPMWIAESDDILGLVLENESLDNLISACKDVIPDLLIGNKQVAPNKIETAKVNFLVNYSAQRPRDFVMRSGTLRRAFRAEKRGYCKSGAD